MPGTGPLRRSSAPARIKALVRKSRFRATAQRSPRLSTIPWTAQNRYPCLGHTVTYVLASDRSLAPQKLGIFLRSMGLSRLFQSELAQMASALSKP
jgi:hypothetical protein